MTASATTIWKPFATTSDTVSAEAIAGRLRSEGVPVTVRTDVAVLGEARLCQVCVPSDMLHRARWIFDTESFTEAELTFLATGELSPDE